MFIPFLGAVGGDEGELPKETPPPRRRVARLVVLGSLAALFRSVCRTR